MTTEANLSLRNRYDLLNNQKKKELKSKFASDQLAKPVGDKTFYKILNLSVAKLKKQPLERIELFAQFFECSIEDIINTKAQSDGL